MMQIVPNLKQGIFSGCFGLLFPSFLKIRIFADIYFSFILHQLQLLQESHFSLTLSSSVHLPTCKEREAAIWLDKRTCSDKLWIKNAWKLLSFHFIFHSILPPARLLLLRSLWAPQPIACSLGHVWPHPMKNLIEYFFHFSAHLCICKNQSDTVISLGGISNQRILLSNWLKALPAIR